MPGSGAADPAPPRAPAHPGLRRFLRHRGAVTGSVLLLALIGMALAAPWLAPYDPILQDQRASLRAPDPAHLPRRAIGTAALRNRCRSSGTTPRIS